MVRNWIKLHDSIFQRWKSFPHSIIILCETFEEEDRLFLRKDNRVYRNNSMFIAEVAEWCEATLKRGYIVTGNWETGTYYHDWINHPEFVISFKLESDAALFKLFWM